MDVTVLPVRSSLTYLVVAPSSASRIVGNSVVLLTFSRMVYGLEIVFAGKVARYAARLADDITVTLQVAVLPPSAVVTIIAALPPDTAVTRPLDDTVATVDALLVHVTFLLVALVGATVAVNVSV
jgi:hypothetical protein